MEKILARALREANHSLFEETATWDAVQELTETEAQRIWARCYRSWPDWRSPPERVALGGFMAIMQAAHGFTLPEYARQGIDQEAVE